MSQLHKEAKEAVHVYIYSCVPVSGWAGGEADMRWQHLGFGGAWLGSGVVVSCFGDNQRAGARLRLCKRLRQGHWLTDNTKAQTHACTMLVHR